MKASEIERTYVFKIWISVSSRARVHDRRRVSSEGGELKEDRTAHRPP